MSRLADGAAALNCSLSERSVNQCLAHMDLLLHWNRVHNLTTVIEPEEIVTRHLLDSLTIASLIRGTHLLDIGSGGGFPGIPLAVALPDTYWTLLDGRGKRVRFLQEVVNRLGLERIEVVQQRVENYRPAENFDTLVARAVAPLPQFVSATQHLWREGVRVIAMKGRRLGSEWNEISPEIRKRAEVVPLMVPGVDLHRQAVVFQN